MLRNYARYLILYCIDFYVIVHCKYMKLKINTTSKISEDSERAVGTNFTESQAF